MTQQTTTTSSPAQEELDLPKPHLGFLEWVRNLIQSLFGSPAEPPTPVDAKPAHAIPANSAQKEGEVIIAPGGFIIHKPKMGGDGEQAVDTNEVENILPDVRQGLNLLPPLPTVVIELLKEIQNASSTASSVAEIAASDPSLAAQILRTVNSAAFGLSRKVTDVTHAVALLGFGIVRSMVVQLRLERIMPHRSPAASVEAEDLWAHSLAVSYIASALADRVRDVDRGLVSTLGLLHDIGRLAIVSQFPDRSASLVEGSGQSTNRLEREAKAFGADHTAIGAVLGNRWQLPSDITKAIRWHHEPGRAFEADDPIGLRKAVFLIQIADQLAKFFFAYSSDMEISPPAEGGFELLGLKGTMKDLLDNKVRTVAGQAVLFAEENSNRPLNIVRAFLKLRRLPESTELVHRLMDQPGEGLQVILSNAGDELIDNADQERKYSPSERGLPIGNAKSWHFKAPATLEGAKWLCSILAKRCETDELPGKTLSTSRAALRALLPNLLDTDKASEALIEMGYRASGNKLELAIRCKKMSFAERLPSIATPEIGCRVLEVEAANLLNLGWFDIQTSREGNTLLFTSK
jgi:putative nucleotidyltransferase with HDIG domain